MINYFSRKFRESSRKKRGQLFRKSFEWQDGINILDLGGWDGSHIKSILPPNYKLNITIADINSDALKKASSLGFNTVIIGENGELPFSNHEFDIVFCNSVIEHVTVDKNDILKIQESQDFFKHSYDHQRRFADEIKRISKNYFVQTPNRYYLIESHTWFPNIFIFLNRKNQIKVINFLNKFWPKKTQPDWNLLSEKQMKNLFPDAKCVKELTFFGYKSIIAIKSQVEI